MKRLLLLILLPIFIALPGCGTTIVVQDDYSLDEIDGEIECEYRIGKDAKWAEECVDSDVKFDKEMFLKLFHEYAQYDPIIGSKNPMKYDLKVSINEQPDVWQEIFESEFNVRAVFGDDQRNVSIYRYRNKLYFFVLSMGDRAEPEKEGEYFVELSDEMYNYWQNIIEEVEMSKQK